MGHFLGGCSAFLASFSRCFDRFTDLICLWSWYDWIILLLARLLAFTGCLSVFRPWLKVCFLHCKLLDLSTRFFILFFFCSIRALCNLLYVAWLILLKSVQTNLSSGTLLVVFFCDNLLIWFEQGIIDSVLSSNVFIILFSWMCCLVGRGIILSCLNVIWIQNILSCITDLIKVRSVRLAHVLTLRPWETVEVEALLRGSFKIIVLHHVMIWAVSCPAGWSYFA